MHKTILQIHLLIMVIIVCSDMISPLPRCMPMTIKADKSDGRVVGRSLWWMWRTETTACGTT